MEDKKTSEKKENQAAPAQTEAAKVLPPAVIEEELKKLPNNFTGTVEIPLTSPTDSNAEYTKGLKELLPGGQGFDDMDFSDFEQLLWGGNMPDMPVVNYGDEYVVTEGEELPKWKKQSTEEEIIEAIRTVEDPEIMLNVYDLGLIYRLEKKENGDVEIDMSVTAPSCPVAGLMPKQVAEAVSKLEGTGKVTVALVWEPAWTIDRMTENAKYILDMF